MSIMFLTFIAAPTAITLLDVDCDVTILFNMNEEEEEKESKESLKELEIKSNLNTHFKEITIRTVKPSTTYFYLKNYTSKTLELASPPPELC